MDDSNNWLAHWRPIKQLQLSSIQPSFILCTDRKKKDRTKISSYSNSLSIRLISPPILAEDNLRCLALSLRFVNTPNEFFIKGGGLTILQRQQG